MSRAAFVEAMRDWAQKWEIDDEVPLGRAYDALVEGVRIVPPGFADVQAIEPATPTPEPLQQWNPFPHDDDFVANKKHWIGVPHEPCDSAPETAALKCQKCGHWWVDHEEASGACVARERDGAPCGCPESQPAPADDEDLAADERFLLKDTLPQAGTFAHRAREIVRARFAELRQLRADLKTAAGRLVNNPEEWIRKANAERERADRLKVELSEMNSRMIDEKAQRDQLAESLTEEVVRVQGLMHEIDQLQSDKDHAVETCDRLERAAERELADYRERYDREQNRADDLAFKLREMRERVEACVSRGGPTECEGYERGYEVLKRELAELLARIEKVPHFGCGVTHETLLCPPKWAAHTPAFCAKQGGRCLFEPRDAGEGGKSDG